jgi:hypothetical protein
VTTVSRRARAPSDRLKTRLSLLDRGIGWGIVALGFVHVLATPIFVPGLAPPALWFASGGGAFVLVGVLNLLRADHSRVVPKLRLVSFSANAATVAFLAVLAALEPRSLWNPTYAAILLVSVATVLSLGSR